MASYNLINIASGNSLAPDGTKQTLPKPMFINNHCSRYLPLIWTSKLLNWNYNGERMTKLMSWASCQIRKIAGCACAGNAGNVFPPPWVSEPDKHHGTCVTHVPWCLSGSLTSGFLWSRWWEKTYSRRMRNPQFYVSGRWPMKHLQRNSLGIVITVRSHQLTTKHGLIRSVNKAGVQSKHDRSGIHDCM